MEANYRSCNPEIWGGIECTINRIGDTFRDQIVYSRFHERKNDIDEIAKLGIKALRYPVLWEAHQHSSEEEEINWDQTAKCLERIRSYDIHPIAGLIHHGSGPRFTSLMDENFPEAFATYATKVATRFPWLEYYTPVNEPLTTARFSGLYGHWFPHHKSEASFTRMLLNQLKATVLAMQAIRKINPIAKLVQTEDLTKTHCGPSLQYQADFENKRRWLTYDILCGKLNEPCFFWYYLTGKVQIKKEELEFFIHNPCPPDIAGFNYYVTSERFLDEKIQSYPVEAHGGNGKHMYADVAAVRATKPAGLNSLLKEAWERFQLPMALTEVHLHCTREEQLRWLKEAYDTCCQLKKEGIDIKAITAWSLLGAFDWNSLLTREDRVYESGVFDLNSNELHPTAVAKLVHALAHSGTFSHPLLNEKGWWHKSYPGTETVFTNSKISPVMILGATGSLGSAFVKLCEMRSIPYCTFSDTQMDLTKAKQVEKAIDEYKPWAIINTASYSRIDEAEIQKEICYQLNTETPANLSAICNKHSIQFMTFSSDLVFDGEKQSPYLETDSVKPLNTFGKSKAAGERMVMNFSSSLIIRTSAFFGPWDKYNFAFYIINSLTENRACKVVKDVTVSPAYIPDLVNKALDLLIDEEKGIWHLSNTGKITWFDFARELADRGGFKKDHIVSCHQHEKKWKATRPGYSALQSNKGIKLPTLENAVKRFFQEKIC